MASEFQICVSNQLIKSEWLLQNLYLIEVEPAPIMLLQPDKPLADRFAVGDSANGGL